MLLLVLITAVGAGPKVGETVLRRGDEIVACGQFFHSTAPVVLWLDPGGFDAYRVERRFVPFESAPWESSKAMLRSPNRFALRKLPLSPEQIERVRGGGWDLPLLREKVDQFVIHFDARGTSRTCFDVLHDRRGLSVHFMLDVDGTIYQTLDLKEGAWHATIANARSIGIEIANIGAYPLEGPDPFALWYRREDAAGTRIRLPDGEHQGKALGPDWIPRPVRADPVVGEIQGQTLRQYDLTREQYDSLIRLTATLCTLFPKIRCDYPRDASGALVRRKLPDEELRRYQGILGHYHVQTNKVDPGPAFQWDKLIKGTKALLAEQ